MNNGVASIGVWFFSVVAAIGLILAAVFFLESSADPWLKVAIGLGAGIAFIALAELGIRARYRVPANALDAAGIGVLYATLYWMHGSGLVPLEIAFPAMLVLTAAAVYLATRHDSMFIAVLGILGGFVTAFLLPPPGSNALALFVFLLALNIGIAWTTIRKGWWLLNSLAVIATAIYEWRWVMQSIDVGHLAMGAAIFAVFAIAGTVPLWYRPAEACPPRHRWIAIAAAHLPLLFAIFVAANVNYGPQYNILFAFLLIIDAGLLAIVWRGGPKWLHMAGGVATLIVFTIWFCVSYTHAAWPLLLAWAVLFIALYLVRVRDNVFAGVLFAPFIGLGIRGEPEYWTAIVLTMFVMLGIVFYVAMKWKRPFVAAIAIALACVALMTLHPPLWMLIALHAILFAGIFVVAGISERHVLAILAVPFLVAVVITAYNSPAAWEQYSAWTLLAIAVVPYLLFIAYPLALGARAKASIVPYVAAGLASLVVFVIAWPAPKAGWIVLAEAALMGVLLWRVLKLDPREPRLTLMVTLTLAFFNVAVAMLLPHLFVLVLALETAVLSWLFTRVRYPLLLLWAAGLAAVVFFRLTFDADLYARWYVYVICGLAMFAAAYLLRNVPALQRAFSWSGSTVARTLRIDIPALQPAFSVAGLFELWFLINLLIANCFHSANGALTFDFATSQPAENVWYTVAWAVIATGLLIFSYLIRWPAARGAALALLIAAVFKAFFFDLWYLHGTDLAISLLGLGASVAVVGIVIQRFTAPTPARASI